MYSEITFYIKISSLAFIAFFHILALFGNILENLMTKSSLKFLSETLAHNTVCVSKTWKIFEPSFCLFDRVLSKFFSMIEKPYSTKRFKFLNFFDWLTHIQSSSNFVQRKKNISRGHNIKLKFFFWEFNFEKKILFTKSTLLIPKMQFFTV